MINTSKNLANTIKDFYSKNKQYIIPATIISSYANICLILKIGNNYIENENNWSNWQNKNKIAPEKLTELLLIEIQKRYTNYKNPLDFLSPLSIFIKTIEKEKNILTFYSKFYNFLKTTRLLKIFPINTNNFLSIKQKLENLQFISDKFFTWLAQYKLETNHAAIFLKLKSNLLTIKI
ncbi:MAG: hypothetical protein UR12_C0017G0005 [candidate division TM6 bacterium GW2011_GWF2_30_66]|nr:MAG: hypothetical protein UR12_C0017G0005 [candidate division TM6 bacterium GW2011_GWF2_30_66]